MKNRPIVRFILAPFIAFRPKGLASVFLCLSVGCHLFNLTPQVPEKVERPAAQAGPSKYTLRVSQFLFLSDHELKHENPLFRELANLRDQVHQELQLPTANTVVQVFIFEDRDHYESFMSSKYPELPKRRAFFIAQPRTGGPEDLLVYTFWGDQVREDLRHELTHALLHSVLKDVPLWLDEGLAEYFEVPTVWKGVNYKHLDLLRQPGAFKPDMARLEHFSQVRQMAPAEYREAWAWVHLMLRDKPEGKAALLAYLQQLRTTANPGLVSQRLAAVYPVPNAALEKHLADLANAASVVPTVQR